MVAAALAASTLPATGDSASLTPKPAIPEPKPSPVGLVDTTPKRALNTSREQRRRQKQMERSAYKKRS